MINLMEFLVIVLVVLLLIKFILKKTRGMNNKSSNIDPQTKLTEVENALENAKSSLSEAEILTLEQERDALKKLAESKEYKNKIKEKKQQL